MNLRDDNKFFLFELIVKRNFSAKYKDSVLGIFWSILRPLLMVIILTIVFSTIFGKNIENYPVYLLSGRCMFDFFRNGTATCINSITGNKNILKRNYTLKHLFVLGSVTSEILNLIISFLLLLAVMIVTNANFYWNTMFLCIIPIIFAIILVTGIGLILSILCVYFTDIKHLWGIIMMLLMYASALFYPMEVVPYSYRQYMILNPLFWLIDQFRHFVIWGTIPDTLNMINTLLLSLIILVIGIIVFKKYEGKVAIKL